MICDTSGLFAFFDTAATEHGDVASTLESEPGPLIVSPFVVAELDYMVSSRAGVRAEIDMLEELASDTWRLEHFDASGLRAANTIIERYRDQDIGIADASLVVLAERHRTKRILTLDHRHFGVLRTRRGEPFELLPG